MAEKIEVPTGSALEDLRRQRDEKKQFDAESKAKTTKTTMGEGKLKFKKGGAIRGGGCEQRGKTKGRFV
jgi:hypothetical protein